MALPPDIDQRLTIIIPTRNRSEFVRRLLSYLDSKNVSWPIILLDSSDPESAAENLAVVERFSKLKGLTYRHDSSGLYQKCQILLRQIKTPYVVMCGDDDFLIPATLTKCLDFLDSNSDCVTCLGPSAIVDPSRDWKRIEPAWPVDSRDPARRG